MEPGEGVVLTVVSGEPEAEVVCGLLRAAGIDCAYRDTEAIDSPLEDFTAAGPREILISDDMKRALDKKPKLVECPPMELKNKSQPVKVYRVVL